MGFLNHATNNVIVDAVLTEKGREMLSRNDGSFSVANFRFGDDEVDYKMLEHYGLIIGKEKIEKNTPVFEAITDENIALKYPLRTFTSNNTNTIFAYPYISKDNITTPIALSSNSDSKTSLTGLVRFKTDVNQDETFSITDSELVDNTFTVKVFNKLLTLSNLTPFNTRGDIDFYRVTSNTDTNIAKFTGQRFGSFNITPVGTVTSSTYQYYSQSSDRTLIKTQIEIIGDKTQSKLIIPVTITSSTISS